MIHPEPPVPATSPCAVFDSVASPSPTPRPDVVELSVDEFEARFPLIPNPFLPDADESRDADPDGLFETFGAELAFVRSQPPATVWTLVDGDEGCRAIVSGDHVVNRLGYFVSHEAVPDNMTYHVSIPSP